jgi:UDP-N-acetylmuramoyl-L-alanyl-D-glutamate--2,6-diaminopimelate ligase
MGEIAGKLADFTIITEDNSRNENVLDIINDIKVGINNIGGNYKVVPDRRKAIEYAMGIAKKDDMILLLGKGHEKYQEHNGIREEFDERKIVLEIINSKAQK